MDPSPPITKVEGDEATIGAGCPAARLGLSVDQRRAEMRGVVYGVIERGVGKDAGWLSG